MWAGGAAERSVGWGGEGAMEGGDREGLAKRRSMCFLRGHAASKA